MMAAMSVGHTADLMVDSSAELTVEVKVVSMVYTMADVKAGLMVDMKALQKVFVKAVAKVVLLDAQ